MSRLRDVLIDKLGDCLYAPEPELRFICPKCPSIRKSPDTSGHFHVNYRDNKFFCFRCGWKGHVNYLLKVLGASVEQSVADWSNLATNMSLFDKDDFKEDSYEPEIIEYPCLVQHPRENAAAWDYLTSPKSKGGRGLTAETIDLYGIVVGSKWPWATRIFVPTYQDGELVFWVARSFAKETPKYLNPKNIDKRFLLFGMDLAKSYDWVIITEGVFSAIAAGPNAVAAFGKSVSKEQRQALVNANFDKYVIALDGDARAESEELARWFESREKKVYLVDMPKDKDPDSLDDFHVRVTGARPINFASSAVFRLTT